MLKLVPPGAPGKQRSPYWSVVGRYLGVRVDRSTGTDRKAIAARVLAAWAGYIERGEVRTSADLPKPADALAGIKVERPEAEADSAPRPLTFIEAAVAYMKAGGEREFLGRILDAKGPHAIAELALEAIDQAKIDNLAAQLYPKATPATKNRQFYTPVSAVLKHGGAERKIRRPKGWRGSKNTFWLEPDRCFRLLAGAEKEDLEFGIFCTMLNYCGLRLTEGLSIACEDVHLQKSFAYLRDSKNGDPRPVFLPAVVVKALRRHPRGLKRKGRLFKWHKGGRIYKLMKNACKRAKIDLPPRVAFHVFCHNYGTWMHHYGELDRFGLTRTRRWKSEESADRYVHTKVTEEARRAAWLPVPQKRRSA